MKLTKFALALLVVPALATVSYAGDADACGMSVRLDPTPQKPTPVQEIAKAEKSLEGGQNAAAIKTILTSFPKIRTATAGANPLETRAMRVFALALARSNGTVSEKSVGVASPDEWTAKGNLEWSIAALREIDAKRPNDPAVQADLGEALSKVPHGQDEALKLLGTLAQKDLMGSPFAYAALAKIRTERGDTAGAETAMKRCEEMSKQPGVCRPAPTARPSAPSPAAKA